MSSPIISKKIDAKNYVWSSANNQYAILEQETLEIIIGLSKGIALDVLTSKLAAKNKISKQEILPLLKDLKTQFFSENQDSKYQSNEVFKSVKIPDTFKLTYTYTSNNTHVRVAFESELEASFIHPKFAHLASTPKNTYDTEFKVFIKKERIYLVKNNTIYDAWTKEQLHYFQGKFSMEFIQAIYGENEDKWMGVFHASAVSNQKKAVLFLGDSGNGKSTSLALLQKHGFDCMADDFVPVLAANKNVYHFPAAISIKQKSLQTLMPFYQELQNAKEYHLKRLHKIVRYLPPNDNCTPKHLPCNDLVFIKYSKDAPLSFTKLAKEDAFQQLVPDSWISPRKENAQKFLNWFQNTNCYQLTYSETNALITTVSKLFQNES
ncbi:MAG: hypothetical protein P8H13_01355 [Polaribacter sp.]|nr:hypothetical protein [Polaribacter sp.]MDG1810567.1 hypothetical protein [Polaribacter sp.]MDG1994108.1 hypothetical protein [Polaribacter sp.]